MIDTDTIRIIFEDNSIENEWLAKNNATILRYCYIGNGVSMITIQKSVRPFDIIVGTDGKEYIAIHTKADYGTRTTKGEEYLPT